MIHKDNLIQFRKSSHITSIYEKLCHVEAKVIEGKLNMQQLITYNTPAILICDFPHKSVILIFDFHYECCKATFSTFPPNKWQNVFNKFFGYQHLWDSINMNHATAVFHLESMRGIKIFPSHKLKRIHFQCKMWINSIKAVKYNETYYKYKHTP